MKTIIEEIKKIRWPEKSEYFKTIVYVLIVLTVTAGISLGFDAIIVNLIKHIY